MNDFQKSGKRLETIPTPVGNMAVPSWEAKRLAELSDEQVLAEVHQGPFVDPFAIGEAIRRGILHKLDENPKRMTFGNMLQQLIDEAEE